MEQRLIFAGFGGQGVMLTGQLVAYAGMLEGKHVAWIPSYGPEMRGGTANCNVTVSDRPIASPIVYEPTGAIVLNQPSLDKFGPLVIPGGVLLINASLIGESSRRVDIRQLRLAANDLANGLGNLKVANMVLLGALLRLTSVVHVESIMAALQKILPPHRHNLLPVNRAALETGMAQATPAVALQGR
ncbi:2-oxoacid:ferredoxin oxidoreductase subunit gamma [Heliobacterium gestii]|uniref:2-oxoacid:ferredoxin oxidoreductase subunit gamma n=1 Tax=Heliomicrobium gestii TaxID=2699 RepID=A0A845L4H1_HELGE|nr:2-oxoacid:acceptor oxidoreductase family protein [Heliomicrobium gestii]MBM7865199.1 2-oxoglutarate ferredoxin oxidoreductase subunit gamma [Heliomicrobium gestii]MZP41467.1 2-oxoacid:ferredoxin oxidoreductase subunit gamma [Heliomicrobium gestii]